MKAIPDIPLTKLEQLQALACMFVDNTLNEGSVCYFDILYISPVEYEYKPFTRFILFEKHTQTHWEVTKARDGDVKGFPTIARHFKVPEPKTLKDTQ